MDVTAPAPGATPKPSPTPSPTPAPYADRCSGAADYALSATGSGFDALEGQRVWLSGVEKADSEKPFRVVAFVSGKVANGSFALTCARGLDQNYWYPSATVVIDADGSGDCSAGDLQLTDLRYGWADDVDFTRVDGDHLVNAIQPSWLSPVQPLTAALVDGTPFCKAFFDLSR